jgi:putative flippase GtrA
MIRHAARFAVVGVLNTGVYYACYLPLRTVVNYFIAHVVATVVAMLGSFLLNCYWTFRTRPTWRKLALFPLTNAVNYVTTTVGVVVLVEWVSVDERIAPLIAALAAIPATFLLSRWLLVDAGERRGPGPVAQGTAADHPTADRAGG